jgi:hypothetical protein
MKTLSKLDWYALASYIVGGGLSGICAFLALLDPKHAAIYAGGAGMAVSVAGVIRIVAKPSNAPAPSIIPDAPIVRPNGVPTGATNVSDTSSILTNGGAGVGP